MQAQPENECAHYSDEEKQSPPAPAKHQMTGARHKPRCQDSHGPSRERKPPRFIKWYGAIGKGGRDVLVKCVSRLQRTLLPQIQAVYSRWRSERVSTKSEVRGSFNAKAQRRKAAKL